MARCLHDYFWISNANSVNASTNTALIFSQSLYYCLFALSLPPYAYYMRTHTAESPDSCSQTQRSINTATAFYSHRDLSAKSRCLPSKILWKIRWILEIDKIGNFILFNFLHNFQIREYKWMYWKKKRILWKGFLSFTMYLAFLGYVRRPKSIISIWTASIVNWTKLKQFWTWISTLEMKLCLHVLLKK